MEAKIINIETGIWTLLKCKYDCSNYGKSLDCPPYTPTADEMDKILRCYDVGILLRTKDDMETINKIVVDLEYFALDIEFFKVFALGAGRCKRCNLS